ncbi:RodZ domain-containing protein [Thalassobacillus sp. CUG 92003]|uniref:helix-turn-helix domain-containing protein n=1 Tax=Thalassobacillus sp. CUG 92003 TaxID=2736641 RepID=UPI0015E6FD29|nr:RodZ domain-containing protein [Thalassobacillus sp. CUG 92003]
MEIGPRLKEAREEQGMSIGQVQEVTKIQKRYLQAIEENNFGVLPGKFYTRAFIREYAAAVGLDPEAFMEEHQNELPSNEDENVVHYSRAQKSRQDVSSSKGSALSKIFPTLITIVLIVGIIVLALYFYQQSTGPNDGSGEPEDDNQVEVQLPGGSSEDDSEDENDAGSDDGENEGSSDEQGDESGNGSDNQDDGNNDNSSTNEDAETKTTEFELQETGSGNFPEHTYEMVSNEGAEVGIKLSGTSYLEVEDGNGESFAMGEYDGSDSPLSYDLSGKDRIYIKIGNASVTEIEINGKQLEYPVDPQETVSQKIWVDVSEPNNN